MKRLFMAALTATTLLTSPVAADMAETTYEDPEMYADAMDARMQEVEWAIQNNPALMEQVVSEALRSNPSVVQEIIRDTLLHNPAIVVGSLQEFQRQQQAGASAEKSDDAALTPDFLSRARKADDAPVRGNPQGTVTIVEFSDYNCGYCRHFDSTLKDLIDNNPDLRVVHREWPILSQSSVDVAKIALAAQEQGAYEDLHMALMQENGAIDKAKALQIAASIGLDAEKLEADAQNPRYWAHIQHTEELAKEIKLRGTPGIIIGDELARGLVSADKIQPIIDRLVVN
jgi:protein-disulfide isomerase